MHRIQSFLNYMTVTQPLTTLYSPKDRTPGTYLPLSLQAHSVVLIPVVLFILIFKLNQKEKSKIHFTDSDQVRCHVSHHH